MPDLVPGRSVILKDVPPGLLSGLPAEDQEAIKSMVGHPVTLLAFRMAKPNWNSLIGKVTVTQSGLSPHTFWLPSAPAASTRTGQRTGGTRSPAP